MTAIRFAAAAALIAAPALWAAPAAAITVTGSSVSLFGLVAVANVPPGLVVVNSGVGAVTPDTNLATGAAGTSFGGGGAANGPALDLAIFVSADAEDTGGRAEIAATLTGFVVLQNTTADAIDFEVLVAFEDTGEIKAFGDDPATQAATAVYAFELGLDGASLFGMAGTESGPPNATSLIGFLAFVPATLEPFAISALSAVLITTAFAESRPIDAPVPLPAAAPLLLVGVGGLAALRRGRRAA